MLIFSLELELSGVALQGIYQSSKKRLLPVRILSEDKFDTVLATFCCYDYGANSSETVEKITTDEKDYQKSSFHQ